MNRLRIIPLDETVVFPGMPVTVSVDVGSDDRVLLVPRQHNTYAHVGVVAEVSERVRLAGRGFAVAVRVVQRRRVHCCGIRKFGPAGSGCRCRPKRSPCARQDLRY